MSETLHLIINHRVKPLKLLLSVGWIGLQDEETGGRKDILELRELALMPHSTSRGRSTLREAAV